MIICSRCGTENKDDVKFCRECGNDLTTNVDAPKDDDLRCLAESLNEQAVYNEKQPFNPNKVISESPKRLFIKLRESIFFRKKKNTIITFVSIALIVLLTLGILNSGYIAFTISYNMGKYDTAKDIQGWSFNNNRVKINIEKFVVAKTKDYYDDFFEEKISYEEANEKFDVAENFTSNDDAKDKADELYASRTAYEKAEEYEKNGDAYNAVMEYLKVIEADKNYNTAKEKIEENKTSVKKQALSQLEKCAAKNDFNKGLKIVFNMEKIFSNDIDINKYKTEFEKRKEAHRIKELKEDQKVKVLSTRSYDDGYYFVSRKGEVIIKNCSDKVLKEATIVILMFDSNGYPIDADYSMYSESSADNSQRAGTGSINLKPGNTFGSRYNWDIADNATKIKACVKSAEFYDGGTWNNPYYSHWLETEKDRY